MAVIETETQDEKTRMYRRVFGTDDGRKVLSDMVVDLNVFSSIPPGDTERSALRNFGLALLYNAGVLVDKNVQEIIDRLLSIDYTRDIPEGETKGKDKE